MAARPILRVWYEQLVGLLEARGILIYRNRISLLLMFLIPMSMTIAVWGAFNGLATFSVSTHSMRVQRCTQFDAFLEVVPDSVVKSSGGKPCITLLYAPSNTKTNAIMRRVAATESLEYGTDIVSMPDANSLAGYIFDNIGIQSVDAAVFFNDSIADVSKGQMFYEIWHNTSLLEPYARKQIDKTSVEIGVSGRLLGIQRAVDSASIEYFLNVAPAADASAFSTSPSTMPLSDEAAELESAQGSHITPRASLRARSTDNPGDIILGDMPTGPPLIEGSIRRLGSFSPFDFIGSGPAPIFMRLAGTAMLCAGFIIATLLVYAIVTGEKQRHLVGALRRIGLYESVYWTSWLVGYVPVYFLVAMATAAVGYMTSLYLFEYCNYMVHTLGFFCLGMGLLSMILCCSSFTVRPVFVSACSFCVFACASIQVVLWSALGLYGIIFRPGTSPFLQVIVSPWPWFHYGAALTLIDNHILDADATSGAAGGGDQSAAAARALANGGARGSFGYDDWGLELVLDEPVVPRDGYLSEEQLGLYGKWTGDGIGIGTDSIGNNATRFPEGTFAGQSHNIQVAQDSTTAEWSWASFLFPGSANEDTFASRWSHLARTRMRIAVAQAVMVPLREATRLSGFAPSDEGQHTGTVPVHQLLLEETVAWISGVKLQEVWEEGWSAALPRWNETFMQKTDPHADAVAGRRLQGGGGSSGEGSEQKAYNFFKWSDLSKLRPKQKAVVGREVQEYHPKNAGFFLGMILGISLGYITLAWYLSQVFTSDDGAALPFYFFLAPSYWGIRFEDQAIEEGDTLAILQRLSGQEGSIRIHKVSKAYDRLQALREVSMTLASNQLFCLLGSNGSGKSTLMKVLAGHTDPTNGEAFLFGRSIRQDAPLLRDFMGSCPQDDLLYWELSAREHLRLYARFKGVPADEVIQHVEDRLSEVRLSKVGDAPVMSFSGGMKRRLSVAMAAVGQVKLLLLDEPTTGLDPLSRRRVWRVIERLKKGGRIIVLTTHLLDEADYLGDNIGILSGGRLRAIGSPLFLKGQYGSGYQLSLLTSPDNIEVVKNLVREHIPEAEFVGDVTDMNAAEQALQGDATGLGIGVQGAAAAMGTNVSALFQQYGDQAGTQRPEGNILQNRAASGSITVALPRSTIPRIPAFLRMLRTVKAPAVRVPPGTVGAGDQHSGTKGEGETPATQKLIREFGISNSTLEEVFLRLAAANQGVNTGGNSQQQQQQQQGQMQMQLPPGAQQMQMQMQGQGAMMSSAAPLSAAALARGQHGVRGSGLQQAAGALEHQARNLGGKAFLPAVTLYRSNAVAAIAYVVRDRPGEDDAEARATYQALQRAVGGVVQSAKSAGYSSTQHDQALMDAPTASGAPSETESGSPDESDAMTNAGATGSQKRSQGMAARAATGPASQGLSAANTDEVSTRFERVQMASGRNFDEDDGGDPDDSFGAPTESENKEYEATPLWQQALGIFIMRWQLLFRVGCACLCALGTVFVVGILIVVVASPSTSPIPSELVRCPQGFYANKLATCNRDLFVNELTTSLWRTVQDAGFNGDAASASPAGGRLGDPTLIPTVNTSTFLISNQACVAQYPDPTGGVNCIQFPSTQGPPGQVTDLGSQFPFISSIPNQVQNGSTWSINGGTQFWIADLAAAQATGSSDSMPAIDWDWLAVGAGFWKSEDGSTAGWPYTVNMIDATQKLPFGSTIVPTGSGAGGAYTAADLDEAAELGQQALYDNRTLVPRGACRQFSRGNGALDGPQFYEQNAAIGAIRRLLPDFVLEFDEASAGGGSDPPKLTYGIRTYSMFNSVSAGAAAADRNNQYQWASIYWEENNFCQSNGIFRRDDSGWVTDPTGPNGPQDHPQLAAVNYLHNAYLRTLIRQRAGQLETESQGPSSAHGIYKALPVPPPNGTLWAFEDRPRLDVAFSQFPRVYYYPKSATSGQGQLQVSALVWPICTMILFPLFAAAIAQEKQSKLYLTMQLGSIRQESYFVGNYAFHVLAAVAVGIVYVGFGYISGSTQFTNASPVLFAAVVLAWAHAQSGFAMLLGSLVNSSLAVTVISVCLIVVSAVAVVIVSSVVDVWPAQLDWVPFIAYARAAALVQSFGGSQVYNGSELQTTLLSTFLEGSAALILAPYFHAVLPGPEQSGTPAHPLYFLKWIGVEPPRSLWCNCCFSLCPCVRRGRGTDDEQPDETTSLRQSNPIQRATGTDSDSLGNQAGSPLVSNGDASYSSGGAASADGGASSLSGGGYQEAGRNGYGSTPASMVNPGSGKDIDVSRETVRCLGREAAPQEDSQRLRNYPDEWYYDQANTAVLIQGMRKEYPARLKKDDRSRGPGGADRSMGDACWGMIAWLGQMLADVFYLTELCNAYGGVKVAVDGFSLGVGRSESVALLGPNGAGKSTIMNCLSGHTSLSAGRAFVGGFDCQTDIHRVQRALGLCPQFDVVWDTLSIKEHFQLFARLKGVPERRIVAEVQQIAEQVGLDGDAFMLSASQLSGGMRRRLSIGLALMGKPKVIVFDEPSTGLDVATRREIWKVLQGVRSKGQAMILTTHSMEEAAELTSRIAICFAGKLEVVGSQLRLKRKYGEGFRLSMTIRTDRTEDAATVDGYVRTKVSADAIKVQHVVSSVEYLLPKNSVDVADVFERIERSKNTDELPISEWGLAQSSLEDVFVSVVEHAEHRNGDDLEDA